MNATQIICYAVYALIGLPFLVVSVSCSMQKRYQDVDMTIRRDRVVAAQFALGLVGTVVGLGGMVLG